MQFQITDEQVRKISAWQQEVSAKVIEQQRKSMSPEDFSMLTMDGKYPYYGASGGGLTFSFTPTSLGCVVKVTEALTGEELDITDYEDW